MLNQLTSYKRNQSLPPPITQKNKLNYTIVLIAHIESGNAK